MSLAGAALAAFVHSASAKTIIVNTVDNTDFGTGQTNLVYALQLLADGDTINFAIPGPGVHTIETPPDGYPLITKNNITIDGYSQHQTGSIASPNTASLHEANNAQLMICLSSVNGNALSMYTACSTFAGIPYPKFGFGDSEQAILGFFRASNAWVRGISFLAAPSTSTSQESGGDCKTICFAMDAPDVSDQRCQNFHVSGCWFGVDPATRQVAYLPDGTTVATPAICIATYNTGTNGTPGFPNVQNQPGPGTIGVAAGSPNPRAEFNVFVTGYGLDSQGGPLRVSGNFWGVLPDGVTLADISTLNGGDQEGDAFVEFGGSHDILIGTDGDGVNDADEGNVFGSYAAGGIDVYFYGSQGNSIYAGNTFGVDIHGNSFGVGTMTRLVHHFNRDNGGVRFGSDFNGVSDALEGNTAVDARLFDFDTGQKTTAHYISLRGNSLVNTLSANYSTPPLGDGQSPAAGQDTYANFIDSSVDSMNIIPVIGAGTTTTTLTGSCGLRVANTVRVVVDLYQADTSPGSAAQGSKWLGSFAVKSPADSNPVEGQFTFNIASLGIAHGTAVTIAATYIIDGPTITALSHTGGNTTLSLTGGNPPYDLYGAATLDGNFSLVAAGVSASVSVPAAAGQTFYRAISHPHSVAGSGQTSPFSNVFVIP